MVSRSTTEAKYRSLANATAELTRFRSLLAKLEVVHAKVPTIWCDNTSTVCLVANPVMHAQVKHVEIDLHFVRDKITSGQLQVNFVPGSDQVADVLA